MELMGIAFIVVLVFVGLLIYVRFAANEKPQNVKKDFSNDQLVHNTMNVLLETTTDCNNMNVKDLLIQLSKPGTYECSPGVTAKDATCRVLEGILPSTFDTMKMGYVFTITKQQGKSSPISVLSFKTDCTKQAETCAGERTTATQPLSLARDGGGTLVISLSVCS